MTQRGARFGKVMTRHHVPSRAQHLPSECDELRFGGNPMDY